MTQTQFSFPSNPFTQYNIAVTANTSSYDNADMLDMAQGVYHFAQQRSSMLLPHLSDVGTMKGQFIQKDRFGGFEFSVRTNNIGDTPHSKHVNSTRGVTSVKLHAGHIMDMDDVGSTRYAIQPRVQMELGNSLGRAIDRVIYTALANPVVEYATTAGNTFQGVQSPSVVSLANSSKYVLGSKQSGSTTALIRWTGTAVDDIVKSFEDDDWDASDICIIMTPALRRQLKKIPDFRDAENLQSHSGSENTNVIRWRDVTFLNISNKIAPPDGLATAADKYTAGSQFSPIVSTGTALSSFTNYANRHVTYAFVKPAIMFRFDENFYSRVAQRRDQQDGVELYVRASFAALRVDDKGVRQLVFSDTEPGTNDGE